MSTVEVTTTTTSEEVTTTEGVNVTVITQPPPTTTTVVTTETRSTNFQYPVLQPLGVLTFWQGIAEIVLRTGICVLAFITMVTAAVARANVGDVSVGVRDAFVNDSVDLQSVFGYSVSIAVFVLIGEVITIIIRILGIGVVNQFWIIFGIIDIANSFFWSVNSFISTVVSGVGSAAASEAKDDCDDAGVQQDVCDDFIPISQSGGAAAFFSILMCLALGALGVYMIVFLVLKWNEKHYRVAHQTSTTGTTNSTEPYIKME